ncbi:hypothetical protein ACFFJ7_09685 [Pseudochelatococcus lubricantis]|uniref:hypothetical protein n=1 Tax=Pseudochelatococcus lubricantis TaxID=1538102 RepID=UPI0035EB8354
MQFSPVPPLAAAFAVMLAGGAVAEEGRPAPRGREGLTRVPMTFANAGPASMACASAIAHWHSLDLGRAETGGSIAFDLWADTASGAIFLLNGSEDRMPVESLWCGIAGRSWETRATIALARRAGVLPPPGDFLCRQAEDRVICEAR